MYIEVVINFQLCVIVGRLSRSQLSKEQAQIYIKEENNRRRNILQKYIRLCTDAKVRVNMQPQLFMFPIFAPQKEIANLHIRFG